MCHMEHFYKLQKSWPFSSVAICTGHEWLLLLRQHEMRHTHTTLDPTAR